MILTRRALTGCGIAAIAVGALSGWIVTAAQVVLQSGGLTGVQAYAALISAIFGVAAVGYGWASRTPAR